MITKHDILNIRNYFPAIAYQAQAKGFEVFGIKERQPFYSGTFVLIPKFTKIRDTLSLSQYFAGISYNDVLDMTVGRWDTFPVALFVKRQNDGYWLCSIGYVVHKNFDKEVLATFKNRVYPTYFDIESNDYFSPFT